MHFQLDSFLSKNKNAPLKTYAAYWIIVLFVRQAEE